MNDRDNAKETLEELRSMWASLREDLKGAEDDLERERIMKSMDGVKAAAKFFKGAWRL